LTSTVDTDVTATQTDGTSAPADVIAPLLDKLPDSLSGTQEQQVEQLLRNYDDIFFKRTVRHGTHPFGSIDTEGHKPIRQGLRRHPIAHLDKQVDELVKHDYVEPAASPWASNVLLVR